MGDRAVALFKDGHGTLEPYAVYFHWAGAEGVAELFAEALVTFKDRIDDESYFSARFVGLACAKAPGSTGIGLLAAPTAEEFADAGAMTQYSPGDAGVAVLTPSKGLIEWVPGTGYGARRAA